MKKSYLPAAAAMLIAVSAAAGQSASDQLTANLLRRLTNELQVKTVLGKPITVGTVTITPVLTVDINFGGAGMLPPPKGDGPSGDAFLMTGEARPVGFIVVTKSGTRFLKVQQ